MISEEEARTRIVEKITPLAERTVALAHALDRFSARDVFARLPLPVFENSAMDGYAVMASSAGKGARLAVIGEQPAGPDRRLRVSAGEAVRIFTGAPIPTGADAVVMQEDVTRDADQILVNTDVEPGEFIRRRGCDLAEGQRILSTGDRVDPPAAALLASQGIAEVLVGGDVKVAILSTGDELVQAGDKLQPGQIYESNCTLLRGLVQGSGAIVNSTEHCRDERESLIDAITRGIQNDILIISGGVSVGEHDLVKGTLHDLGADIEIWRVAIKPGKPFLFGRMSSPSPQSSRRSTRSRTQPGTRSAGESSVVNRDHFIFGLPGNPVSAFVTFLQFVRPAILKMMGAAEVDLPQVPAMLTTDLTNDGDRSHYIRGKLERGQFTPIGRQESHALFGLSQSNSLLRLDVGESVTGGVIVQVQIWD